MKNTDYDRLTNEYFARHIAVFNLYERQKLDKALKKIEKAEEKRINGKTFPDLIFGVITSIVGVFSMLIPDFNSKDDLTDDEVDELIREVRKKHYLKKQQNARNI